MSSDGRSKVKVVRKYVDQPDVEKIIDLSQTKVVKGKTKRSTGWRASRTHNGKLQYYCKSGNWSEKCDTKKFVVGDKLSINSPESDITLEPIDYK